MGGRHSDSPRMPFSIFPSVAEVKAALGYSVRLSLKNPFYEIALVHCEWTRIRILSNIRIATTTTTLSVRVAVAAAAAVVVSLAPKHSQRRSRARRRPAIRRAPRNPPSHWTLFWHHHHPSAIGRAMLPRTQAIPHSMAPGPSRWEVSYVVPSSVPNLHHVHQPPWFTPVGSALETQQQPLLSMYGAIPGFYTLPPPPMTWIHCQMLWPYRQAPIPSYNHTPNPTPAPTPAPNPCVDAYEKHNDYVYLPDSIYSSKPADTSGYCSLEDVSSEVSADSKFSDAEAVRPESPASSVATDDSMSSSPFKCVTPVNTVTREDVLKRFQDSKSRPRQPTSVRSPVQQQEDLPPVYDGLNIVNGVHIPRRLQAQCSRNSSDGEFKSWSIASLSGHGVVPECDEEASSSDSKVPSFMDEIGGAKEEICNQEKTCKQLVECMVAESVCAETDRVLRLVKLDQLFDSVFNFLHDGSLVG